MRISLVGDYSGFHKNLKEGLQELGHDALLISTGDGFKNLPSDLSLSSSLPGAFGKLERVFRSLSVARSIEGSDIVQFINPHIFPKGLGFNEKIIRHLIKNCGKSFLSACGDDYQFVSLGHKCMRYSPIPDSLTYDYKISNHPYDNKLEQRWTAEIVEKVEGIIPVMYEYKVGYSHYEKCNACIPLPVNVSNIEFQPLENDSKLKIFHGLNRYGFKGTRHVEKAFRILGQKYPNELDLNIKGGMPFKEYLKVLSSSHVVVDQTNSYSSGMNALYALALGKIVLGGAEPESLNALKMESSPVINVKPDYMSIVDAIERILDRRREITRLSFESRAFVTKYHDHISVAKQYLEAWGN